DDTAAVEKHLEECASCRNELERLRGDAALLALTTSGPRPPAKAKSRLMEALAKEAPLQSARTRVPRWGVLGWLAVAVVVLFMATLWRQNSHLSSKVATLSAEVERQRAESQQARRVAEILHAPDAVPYDVMPVSTKTMPSGKALYSRERSG